MFSSLSRALRPSLAARVIAPSTRSTVLKACCASLSTYAVEPFSPEIVEKLRASVDPQSVRIRPDGFLFLPEIKYRKLLNDTFGPGGWCLVPCSPAENHGRVLVREYALWALGRFVAQAPGDMVYTPDKGATYGAVIEGCRSNALSRCCKDLGVAAELWDAEYTETWKREYAEHVFVKTYNGATSKIWKRIDEPLPSYMTLSQAPQQSSNNQSYPSFTSQSSYQSEIGGAEDLDLDNVVPPFMKKFNGRTWGEVLADPKGPQYLEWIISSSNADDGLKAQCTQALESVGKGDY